MTDRVAFRGTLKDDHIFRLTDDTGMFQHSKYGVPDPAHGYTTDDNARALIMALMLYGRSRRKKYLDLVYRYSSFMLYAQNEKGRFKNFMGYDRKWLEDEGSEDCFGRCVWALGFALSNEWTPQGVRQALAHMLDKALPNAVSLVSPRAIAYTIAGLACLDGIDAKNLVFELAQNLCRWYDRNSDGEWKWFENIVAYSNGILPRSLFSAYRVTGGKSFLEVAEESLGFLTDISFNNGCFKPVGCKGWYLKGETPAEFDEQPVEACEAVLAYLEAYAATGKEMYRQKAKQCHAWYNGVNSKGIPLIDSHSGGCYDGLTEEGVNLNMGAESLVSYFISYLAITGSI